jgi:hypothetical protein
MGKDCGAGYWQRWRPKRACKDCGTESLTSCIAKHERRIITEPNNSSLQNGCTLCDGGRRLLGAEVGFGASL